MPRTPTSSNPSLARPIIFGGTVLVALLATGLILWRPIAQAEAEAPVVLKSVVESLPGQTMKSYSIRVPHDGRLSLEVSTTDQGEFSAYLMRIEESLALTRSGGLDIITAFSAERIRHYQREAPIKAGTYHLTLANFSPLGENLAMKVGISARLSP